MKGGFPYWKGALYVRPVLWGSGAILGVAPAPEFTLWYLFLQ